MALAADIQRDLIQALKSHDDMTVGTLRMVTAAFHNREIEKRGKGDASPLSEDETLEVLRREVKKRREAIGLYEKGGRPELAEKEKAELAVLQKYLPAGVSEAEIEAAVDRALAANPGATKKEFGKVMKAAMQELGGRAEGPVVAGMLNKKLS